MPSARCIQKALQNQLRTISLWNKIAGAHLRTTNDARQGPRDGKVPVQIRDCTCSHTRKGDETMTWNM